MRNDVVTLRVVEASVRLTRRLAASPEEVWAALTEPESVMRWLGRPVPGEARVVERHRRLELDWRPDDEPPSLVRFDLLPVEGGTTLVLDHSRLDEPRCMRYGGAWTRAAVRLERLVAA
jgi:uncharacterized protein YndB with AHSA1/START domain